MDSRVNSILRRSSLVDTSGALPPVLTSLRLESGVYVSSGNATQDAGNDILQGRISLGLIAIAIVGAVGFYYFTRSIQGGG
jgi:hypothetical protein